MMSNIYKSICLGLLLTALSLPSYSESRSQPHSSIDELKSLSYDKAVNRGSIVHGTIDPDDIRLKEMKNTALSIGAQNGFVYRLNQLKSKIDNNSRHLDSIFDFSVIMRLSGGEMEELHLLPPVISEVRDVKVVSDSSTRIRISDLMYSIDSPARLVTVAPNWRQYLIYDQPVDISKPVANLLPRNGDEQKKWKEWVDFGWKAGISQAEREMSYRIRRLGQDFVGMTRYMILASEGKVNKPVVVASSQDVTGGGGQMRINDQVVQLSVPASLNPDDNNWEPLVLDNRGSLRLESESKSRHD